MIYSHMTTVTTFINKELLNNIIVVVVVMGPGDTLTPAIESFSQKGSHGSHICYNLVI